MASSKHDPMDRQVCTATQALFSLATGKRRIQVELLIPADFNRFGDPLKGSRVMEIIRLLLIKPGFGTYKYECAWVVSPDPNGGFMLPDLASRHVAMDAFLPKRDRQSSYSSTFRMSHLACALLIIKLGTYKWPGTERLITKEQGNQELQVTLREGMWCQTWDHTDVYANLEDFKMLMASDNWEADEQMGDCELSVLNRICECLGTVHSAEMGRTMNQTVINKVKKICSTAWTDAELVVLLDYAKGSNMSSLALLRIFQSVTTDPIVFNVPIRHFKDVTEHFPTKKYQDCRVTITCAMYGADREKEVKKVGGRGKIEPIVINKGHMEVAAQIDVAELNKVEEFLKSAREKYWEELQPQAHFLGQVLIKEFCEFLNKNKKSMDKG